MLTSRLGYFLPTTKIYSITKEKAQCGNYHYHKPLFTVCTVDLQMKCFRAWRSMAWGGGRGFFFSLIYVIVFPTVASRTCDLEAKQIKKKKKKKPTKTAFTMFENNVKSLPKDLPQSPTHQRLLTNSFDRNSSQHMCQNRLQRKPASIII